MTAAMLFCAVSLVAAAQPYRQLTVNDFRGTPRRGGPTIAETACFVDLKYDVHHI